MTERGEFKFVLKEDDRGGCTEFAEGIFFQLAKLIESDPFLDVDGFGDQAVRRSA